MPRAIVFEPQTRLVFVIKGAQPVSEELVRAADGTLPRRRGNPKTSRGRAESTVTVVDSESRKQLAQIVLSGRLGFAEADGNGRIFVAVADSNQIVRLDAEAIGSTLRGLLNAGAAPAKGTATENPAGAILDWTSDAQPLPPAESRPRFFTLGSGCQEPRALAVDAAHQRLFAACTNQKMIVLNADTGEAVSSVPIGPGADAVGYDSDRGLIFRRTEAATEASQ